MRKTNTTTWVDFLAPPPPYFWAKTRHYIQYSKVCFSSDKSTNPGVGTTIEQSHNNKSDKKIIIIIIILILMNMNRFLRETKSMS